MNEHKLAESIKRLLYLHLIFNSAYTIIIAIIIICSMSYAQALITDTPLKEQPATYFIFLPVIIWVVIAGIMNYYIEKRTEYLLELTREEKE